jgi:hypothetical protein
MVGGREKRMRQAKRGGRNADGRQRIVAVLELLNASLLEKFSKTKGFPAKPKDAEQQHDIE